MTLGDRLLLAFSAALGVVVLYHLATKMLPAYLILMRHWQ